VRALLQRSKLQRVVITCAADQPEHVAVERLRFVEVAGGHHGVAGAGGIKGWGKIGFDH